MSDQRILSDEQFRADLTRVYYHNESAVDRLLADRAARKERADADEALMRRLEEYVHASVAWCERVPGDYPITLPDLQALLAALRARLGGG